MFNLYHQEEKHSIRAEPHLGVQLCEEKLVRRAQVMFRFNFKAEDVFFTQNQNCKNQEIIEKSCDEVIASDAHRELDFKPIHILDVEFFVRHLDNGNDPPDETFMKSYKNCDVIPSIYEGGFKVWECTYDLLMLLVSKDFNFKDKTILDLGCGCGLLGIFAGMKGAKMIHFQDYNTDVLNDFTIPNVHRNKVKSVTRFFSGDWRSFNNSSFIESFQYDFILTSETLYNTSNYETLCELFTRKLKNNGEVFIASKSYYFGVGGSVQQFQEHLNYCENLRWETCWKNYEGVQREILRVTKN